MTKRIWGRKARRIAELEAALQDALENLVTVVVPTPEPIHATLVGVTKDRWYRVSYMVRVGRDGLPATREHFVGYADEEPTTYFDGTWTG